MTVGFRDLLALNVHSMAPLIAADAALAIVGAALFASLGEGSQAVVGVVVMFATFMLFIFVNTVFKVRDFGSLSYTTGWRVFAVTAVRRRDLVNSRNVASAIVFVPQAVAGAVLMIAGYMLPGSAMVACACMGVMAAVFQNAWLLNGGSISNGTVIGSDGTQVIVGDSAPVKVSANKSDDYRTVNDDRDEVLDNWEKYFEYKPEPLTKEEKREYLDGIRGVALASDAFFPFDDNIERARKSGADYIAEPGGSVRDDIVIDCCDKYGIAMAFTGMRLFHH